MLSKRSAEKRVEGSEAILAGLSMRLDLETTSSGPPEPNLRVVKVVSGPKTASASNPSKLLAASFAKVIEALNASTALSAEANRLPALFAANSSGSEGFFTVEEVDSVEPRSIPRVFGQVHYGLVVVTDPKASASASLETEARDFLAKAYELDAQDQRKALMHTYRTLDAWLLAGRYEACDEVLALFDAARMSEAGCVGLLTVCAAARTWLLRYRACAGRVRTRLLIEHGERETEEILRGLE